MRGARAATRAWPTDRFPERAAAVVTSRVRHARVGVRRRPSRRIAAGAGRLPTADRPRIRVATRRRITVPRSIRPRTLRIASGRRLPVEPGGTPSQLGIPARHLRSHRIPTGHPTVPGRRLRHCRLAARHRSALGAQGLRPDAVPACRRSVVRACCGRCSVVPASRRPAVRDRCVLGGAVPACCLSVLRGRRGRVCPGGVSAVGSRRLRSSGVPTWYWRVLSARRVRPGRVSARGVSVLACRPRRDGVSAGLVTPGSVRRGPVFSRGVPTVGGRRRRSTHPLPVRCGGRVGVTQRCGPTVRAGELRRRRVGDGRLSPATC